MSQGTCLGPVSTKMLLSRVGEWEFKNIGKEFMKIHKIIKTETIE